jgi:2,5-diamino-6-(ribosylamino)-4(3H)-pyrimidinone 5'-phosphate reductase
VARPRVTIHNLVSVDGRMTGFPADLGVYYGTAGQIRHEAILTGSRTLLEGAAAEGIDLASPTAAPEPTAGAAGGDTAADPAESTAADLAAETAGGTADERPWLAIVDGGGRIAAFSWLRAQPYWRDLVVLGCAATPAEHLERLTGSAVEHVVAGDEHVDLAAALEALHDRYGVRAVRVDAGGTLNGQLLARGLVDEVSVIVAPQLVGAQDAAVHLVDVPMTQAAALRLLAVEELPGGHVWLRYAPAGAGDA